MTTHQAANKFIMLFEGSQNGILLIDFKTGKIEDANQFITALLEFSKEELVGKELWEIGAIVDKKAALAAYDVLIRDGSVRYKNLPLMSKSGKIIDVEFISNVYDLDHHPIIQCIVRSTAKENEVAQIFSQYKGVTSVNFEEVANSFSFLIEKRDSYTAVHQVRVAKLAVAIAQELGLHPFMIDGIRFAAKVHDIGKIGIPSEILTKPGRLDSLEIALLRNHALAGYDVFKNMTFPWPIAQTILQHHERLDGSGYPNQIRGGEIIYEAKILAVADTVEAMSSRRPYRATPGIKVALETIKAGSGVLFDIDVVNACLKVFEGGFEFDADLPPQSHETEHL